MIFSRLHRVTIFHIHGEQFMKSKYIVHLLIVKYMLTMLQTQNSFFIHINHALQTSSKRKLFLNSLTLS